MTSDRELPDFYINVECNRVGNNEALLSKSLKVKKIILPREQHALLLRRCSDRYVNDRVDARRRPCDTFFFVVVQRQFG